MDQDTQDRPFWMIGHRARLLDTKGDFAMLEIVTEPGVPGPPPHRHADCSEFFYVVSGSLEVMAAGAWRTLEAGQSFSIDKDVVHTFRNSGEVPTTWITGFTPRGFEEMFLAVGVPVDQPDARAASTAPERLRSFAELAPRYHMVIEAA